MSTIFGGGVSKASRAGQQAQQQENIAAQRFIEQQAAQARGDVLGIFPSAQQVRGAGFQGALDIIGQGIPEQLSAFQQGNIGAQGVTAQTLPQIQAAILGLPVGGFSPVGINVDPSFLSGIQAPQITQPDLARTGGGALGQIGMGGFGGGFGGGRFGGNLPPNAPLARSLF